MKGKGQTHQAFVSFQGLTVKSDRTKQELCLLWFSDCRHSPKYYNSHVLKCFIIHIAVAEREKSKPLMIFPEWLRAGKLNGNSNPRFVHILGVNRTFSESSVDYCCPQSVSLVAKKIPKTAEVVVCWWFLDRKIFRLVWKNWKNKF